MPTQFIPILHEDPLTLFLPYLPYSLFQGSTPIRNTHVAFVYIAESLQVTQITCQQAFHVSIMKI
ncbi:hypothetical protein H1Q63_13020 [Desmonostoc muscorum CCALA 125]|nr:hypothetical protein [Desmonostoc muscorum CCALA 125]